MKDASKAKITDITRNPEYEEYLYRCLVGPFRRYRKRVEYLKKAVPEGFHKKLLIFDGKIVGQIEYAPTQASYYPIIGDNAIVMNCIWVLRKAGGHNFGRRLLQNMMTNEEGAAGFATIALENHWSPWFKKWQMEKLGFKPIDSCKVTNRRKHKGEVFGIHLMWMPLTEDAEPPSWDKQRILEGITFCIAHPLYNPQTWKGNLLEAK